ncbi:GTPase activating protein [Podila minutissima]|uniref:GTPase-activating protein GYP7 n=1 Tax=Podila minutissima TaxID=64525 RepID=A0A9P5VIX9_9FUNG|nr:GTPase activating protein [Podila minutissima]
MENDPLVAQMEDFELEQSALFAQPKLLFTRPKVYVKTSADNKDGMPGFISVIETINYEHILSWTPEASIPGLDEDAYVDISSQGDGEAPPRSPNTRRSFHPSDYEVNIPLQQIYSLLVYPPRMKDRHGSIIVNLMGGESLPAFYFHDDANKGKGPSGGPPSWGGQELLQHLEQVSDIVGSAIEPGVYLVNATQADKVNHGSASPPQASISHPLMPDAKDATHDNESLYPKLDVVDPLRSETNISMGASSPKAEDTGVATATGPITIEGMRRRRSPSRTNQESSTTASPSAGSGPPGPFARPRTPLPFENHIDPIITTVKEMRWTVLERFSQVARFSRETATNILDHPITKQILPPHVQQRIQESEAAKRVMDDYDSARVYLAKWAAAVADQGDRERRELQAMDRLHSGSFPGRHSHASDKRRINDHEDEEGPLGSFNVLDLETECAMIHHTRTEPLSPMDWFAFFDEQGRLTVTEAKVREAVFRGGIDHDIRIEVWKFFLGVYPWNSTEAERIVIRATKIEEYFALKREWFDSAAVQETEAFQEQKLRIEKDVHRTDRTISFFASETLPNPSGDFTGVGSNENLELLKDILLTYNVWAAKEPTVSTTIKPATPEDSSNSTSSSLSSAPSKETNLLEGYVQGMSDLLAPVFAVMGDEVMGFWAFVGLMEKTKKNFYRDQVGMQSQLETLGKLIQTLDPKLYKHLEKCEALNLFFCFRWLLIWFKREFEWVDIMRLWEVLFSDHLSTQFHLFVAMAILDKHRDVMMDHLQEFDEILKYVNDLSMTIDLEETLQDAEILYRRLECLANKVDAKRLELEQGSTSSSGSAPESSVAAVPELPPALRRLLTQKK